MPDPMTAERTDPDQADATMRRLLAGMRARLEAFLGNLAGPEAEDLVQETMARAWRSRARFDPELGAGASWVLRIAFRTFLDHRRRRGADAVAGAMVDHEVATNGHDPARQAEQRDHLAAMLGRLSATERGVLLRFHRDGESIDEIARALAMPTGTVKSHLHRARNRLWAIELARGDDR